MSIGRRLRLRSLAAVTAVAVVAQLGIVAGTANADSTPAWKVEVAKIPATKYTRDAKVYATEATQALRPYVGDGLGDSRLEPVLADIGSRYFDGARLKSADDGAAAFDNLEHFDSFLKGRLNGASPPQGEAEQAHITALVDSLSGVRLLADAAIQDAEATIGPFRAIPPPAPAPAGLADAFSYLDTAKAELAKTDDMLIKGNPEPASVHAAMAWQAGFSVLTRLGITYKGDHDADGVIDVVELRFGASPLLVDSDGDGLTDKTEITQLAGWTLPSKADSDGDGVRDGDEDIDGDGLTNLQEQALGTKLTDADTDGDGLSDGAEVAKGTNPLVPDQPKPDPIGGSAPPISPAPTAVDTDGDGLSDQAEGEIGSDPANVDTDGDGLSDGQEENVLSLSSVNADTDGDGLSDSYELQHAQDQGLDPAVYDERVSKWSYVTDFLLGLVAGDFDQKDSLAWLAGNLCSGGLGFIPVVGTILGLLTDVRDAIADLIHADWVGAGISIVGIVPEIGDAIELAARVARFVVKFPSRLIKAIRMVARNGDLPSAAKRIVFKVVLSGRYDDLVGKFGVGEEFLEAVIRGGHTDLNTLHAAMSAMSSRELDDVAGLFYNSTDAENWVADQLRKRGRSGIPAMPGDRQAEIHNIPGDPSPNMYRKPDYLEQRPDGTKVSHEVKAGTPTGGRETTSLKQCEQDGRILRSGVDKVTQVVWHFVPYANDYFGSSYGPSATLLECLTRNQIPFSVYLP
jgi:hypothetical protein